MEEACLVVYCPGAGGVQPPLVFSPDLIGAKTRTDPENERVSFVSQSCVSSTATDFRSRAVSSFSSAGADVYVSQPLSASNAVCLARVEGMVCHSCVQLIETTIAKEPGVHDIRVSLSGKEAMVEFDPAKTNPQAVVSAIDDMGFEAQHIATHASEPPVSAPFQNETGTETVVIGVEGMVCQSCVSNISTNLEKMEGVKDVSVSLSDKNATVTYDRGLLSVRQLCEAIEDLGFEANHETAEIKGGVEADKKEVVKRCFVKIEGMTCHSCVSLIESVVRGLGGVVSVTVTLATKEGVVEYREGEVGEGEIQSAIEDTGFEVMSISATSCEVPVVVSVATGADSTSHGDLQSSDSEGADSDNPLLSPNEQGLTLSPGTQKKRKVCFVIFSTI